MPRFDMSAEQIDWIRLFYPKWRIQKLTERFNARFGLGLSPSQVQGIIKRNRIRSGRPRGAPSGELRADSPWTPEMLDWLRAHRAEAEIGEIAERFNTHFGLDMTRSAIAGTCKRYGILSGRDSRFKQGETSWNKGRSFRAGGRSAETRFKPGQQPHTTVPVGSYVQNSEGYWRLKVCDDARQGLSRNNWAFVHRLVYEEACGPIPPGHAVVLIDGDPDNCLDPNNLAAVDRATLVRANQAGWSQAKTTEERRAILALAQVHSRAHQVGRDAGIGARERREMIGSIRDLRAESVL
ncbi:HNH endonuclease signature motif containing protein [Thiorhodococcus fuscus]|uniref:HNH endonuclease signature motif containing protein n=1 Tax=Thiorhodococcus fuscus TaxID=527200 RepID=A0ABW4YB31_9GAMM